MADRRVSRSPLGAASYSGNASGLAVDSDLNQLQLNIDGTKRPIATDAVKVLTAAHTATTAESGTTYFINTATGVTVTLPSTAEGLKYSMVIGVVSTSGTHAFSPAAADAIILAGGANVTVDKDLQSSASADAVGDSVTIIGTGTAATGWLVVAVTEATPDNWGKES